MEPLPVSRTLCTYMAKLTGRSAQYSLHGTLASLQATTYIDSVQSDRGRKVIGDAHVYTHAKPLSLDPWIAFATQG